MVGLEGFEPPTHALGKQNTGKPWFFKPLPINLARCSVSDVPGQNGRHTPLTVKHQHSHGRTGSTWHMLATSRASGCALLAGKQRSSRRPELR
jgi:hypothetical protein